MRNIIREIGRERTVIFSTHILQEVVATCERVIIINNGRIVADDRLENLAKEGEIASLEKVFLSLTEA